MSDDPKAKAPPESEVTPEALYRRRREFLKTSALFLGTVATLGGGLTALTRSPPDEGGASKGGGGPDKKKVTGAKPQPLSPAVRGRFATDEAMTPWADVTSYNNFYEFGTSKGDPARLNRTLRPRPWTVVVDGEVEQPQRLDIDWFLKEFPIEERIYRMRCVEAWSMVIPWLGVPLADVLRRLRPTSRAKYVAFTALLDPEQLPGQKRPVLEWPYREGLRLDEAMHRLAILAVGLYGKTLPNQNGAPLRLVVPWKYGFKGIKSIVRIELVETQPVTTWNIAAPDEYGFYANVNPAVDHPRWTQAKERRIGELTLRPTLPFNGYADQVASLYTGMDLRKLF